MRLLRIVNALVYAGLALFGASAIGRPLSLALGAAVRRYTYAPDLTAPWLWLLLALALTLVLADTGRLLALGQRAGMIRYATLLAIVAVCLGARKSVGTPMRPVLDEGVSHLLARVELAADAVYTKEKRYPDQPEVLTARWSPELTDLGYFRRGAAPLRATVRIVPNVYSPVLVADEDVRPGDVVFALTPDGRRYWATAFVLSHGRIVPMVDSAGHAVIEAAIEGHPTSRLDPLFPEYPNKIPHHMTGM